MFDKQDFSLPKDGNKFLYLKVAACNNTNNLPVNIGVDMNRQSRFLIFNLMSLVVKAQVKTAHGFYPRQNFEIVEQEYPMYVANGACKKLKGCSFPLRTCEQKNYSTNPNNPDISLISLQDLALNSNLIALIIETIHVTGMLPLNISDTWPVVQTLVFANSDIHGEIPPNIGMLRTLRRLHIEGSCFEGKCVYV